MADKHSAGQIPDGWEIRNEIKEDGSKNSCYWCPATGQNFLTYEDMMRYVNYAKEAKLSIYATGSDSNKLKKKAGFTPRKIRPSFAARRTVSLGQSSKPLPLNQGKRGNSLKGILRPVRCTDKGKNVKANTDPAGDTDTGKNMKASTDPAGDTDTGKKIEADQAGLEVGEEPDIGSSELEVSETVVKKE